MLLMHYYTMHCEPGDKLTADCLCSWTYVWMMGFKRRYGYYLAAAAGVKVPRAVKKSITTVQLAQFALFFAHALYGTIYATHYRPRIIIVLCLFQAVVFASLFGNFFWCAVMFWLPCSAE